MNSWNCTWRRKIHNCSLIIGGVQCLNHLLDATSTTSCWKDNWIIGSTVEVVCCSEMRRKAHFCLFGDKMALHARRHLSTVKYGYMGDHWTLGLLCSSRAYWEALAFWILDLNRGLRVDYRWIENVHPNQHKNGCRVTKSLFCRGHHSLQIQNLLKISGLKGTLHLQVSQHHPIRLFAKLSLLGPCPKSLTLNYK